MNLMNSKFASLAVLGLLASASATPALAQDPPRIVLEGKAGSVMTSTGTQYESASPGKVLVIGESLMLGDNSTATVAYSFADGRRCVEKYEGANTFTIDGDCNAAWVASDGSSSGTSAWIILGAGVLGAAVLESMDEEPVGPLSTGPSGIINPLL